MKRHPQVGDVISLKAKYNETASHGIIVEIEKAEKFGDGGWISFTYKILTENDNLVYITESCIETIINER